MIACEDKPGDQEIAAPGGDRLAGIEGNARGRDHRSPMIDGIGEFRMGRRVGDIAPL